MPNLKAKHEGESGMSQDTLDATRWRLTAYQRDGALQNPPEGADVTLEFSGDHAGGRGGCNLYSAQIELDQFTIRFSQVVSTRMMCPPPFMDIERRYFAALYAARSWEQRDSTLLELRDSAGATILVYELIGRAGGAATPQ
jgi:heat shock protein HslJ